MLRSLMGFAVVASFRSRHATLGPIAGPGTCWGLAVSSSLSDRSTGKTWPKAARISWARRPYTRSRHGLIGSIGRSINGASTDAPRDGWFTKIGRASRTAAIGAGPPRGVDRSHPRSNPPTAAEKAARGDGTADLPFQRHGKPLARRSNGVSPCRPTRPIDWVGGLG